MHPMHHTHRGKPPRIARIPCIVKDVPSSKGGEFDGFDGNLHFLQGVSEFVAGNLPVPVGVKRGKGFFHIEVGGGGGRLGRQCMHDGTDFVFHVVQFDVQLGAPTLGKVEEFFVPAINIGKNTRESWSYSSLYVHITST